MGFQQHRPRPRNKSTRARERIGLAKRTMPLSPPTSNNGELMPGLHHFLQHNSNTSYPEQYDHSEGGRLHSNYGSPHPSQGRPSPRPQSRPQPGYQFTQQYLEPGHGMPYVSCLHIGRCDAISTNTKLGQCRHLRLLRSVQHARDITTIIINGWSRYDTDQEWTRPKTQSTSANQN